MKLSSLYIPALIIVALMATSCGRQPTEESIPCDLEEMKDFQPAELVDYEDRGYPTIQISIKVLDD
jgi:hypothetical protein